MAEEMQDEAIEESPKKKECFKIKALNMDNPSGSNLLLYYATEDLHLVRGEIHMPKGKIRLSKGDDFQMMPFNIPDFTALSNKEQKKVFCTALNREVDAIELYVDDTTYQGEKAKQQWSGLTPWWISYEKKDLKASLIRFSQ